MSSDDTSHDQTDDTTPEPNGPDAHVCNTGSEIPLGASTKTAPTAEPQPASNATGHAHPTGLNHPSPAGRPNIRRRSSLATRVREHG